MRSFILLILFFFLSSNFRLAACDCPDSKKVVEFLSSQHVFVGEIISKVYSPDKQHYTLKFEVTRHFKEGNNQKYFEFVFTSEGEFTGEYSSCDWNANKGENWIIYTYYWKGKLTFSGICSHSRRVNDSSILFYEDVFKANWNNFDKSKYILTSLDGQFEKSLPKINLDSLLHKYYNKNYGDKYGDNVAYVASDINEAGNVIELTYWKPGKIPYVFLIDSIYNLDKYIPLKHFEPDTEFSKDVMNELMKIKKWDSVYISKTKISVKYRKFMQFYKVKDSIISYY